jgi:DNA replication protein DnaD
MKDLFEFKLSQSINTSIGNELKDIDTLYLKCFNIKDHRYTTISLRNQYQRMILGVFTDLQKIVKESNSASDEKEQKAEDIKALFPMFEADKFIEFYKKFVEFLQTGISFKDENCSYKLIQIDFDKINPDDLELLIAKYIEVFFVSLWSK